MLAIRQGSGHFQKGFSKNLRGRFLEFAMVTSSYQPSDKTSQWSKGGQGNATFIPVNTYGSDPVFKSVSLAGFLVAVRHNWSLSKVPQDFVKLGETRTSYQIIAGVRHKTKPIYGFQFHPELPVPGFWFGQEMLRNFLSTLEVKPTEE